MKYPYLVRIVTLALLLIVAILPVNAQEEIVLERVDQAMAHLTTFVGSPSAITRQSHFWTWQEQIWADAGLGCPIADQSYPEMPNRGPRITITYNDVDYTYHVAWDGSVLVLCGADGTPQYRSDDPALLPEAPTPSSFDVPNFYTWVYMQTQQRLYLINSVGGEVASLERPMVAGEQFDGLQSIGFSRDGRYLLQVVTLADGLQAVTIFDMQTGSIIGIPAGVGERASLGTQRQTGSVEVAGRLITNSANNRVVISFTNETDPMINAWRVLLVDLTNGTILRQLSHTELPPMLSDAGLLGELNSIGSARPVPVMIDNNDTIHFFIVRLFAGGAREYPAVAWNPATNTAVRSPFGLTTADILPDGQTIYAYYDPAFPADFEFVGMMDPDNVVATTPFLSPSPTQTILRGGSNRVIYRALWAADGNQLVYVVDAGDGMTTQYVVREIATATEYVLNNETVGAPGGVLTTTEAVGGPAITYFNSPTAGQPLWIAPPMNGEPVFAWVQFGGIPLGLTSLFDGQSVTGGAGIDLAPIVPPVAGSDCGLLPSTVSVGMAARSTIIDGSTLNVRVAAGTSAAISRIIPEDTRFTIIGGPTCANGYTWWAIQLEDGLTGWVAEAGTEEYFIEPAP